ncbi:hypothetical protein, partial [Pantoea wallisii]|uniref:hypothetical protein n=1 Tax=Pantoea wallisii TaxID=1076551 RepID=UPI001ABF89C7
RVATPNAGRDNASRSPGFRNYRSNITVSSRLIATLTCLIFPTLGARYLINIGTIKARFIRLSLSNLTETCQISQKIQKKLIRPHPLWALELAAIVRVYSPGIFRARVVRHSHYVRL